MLTTRRFNRRRAAEIRARHQKARKHKELVSGQSWEFGLHGATPSLSEFDQGVIRFEAERLRVLAGQECGAALSASKVPPKPAKKKGWLNTYTCVLTIVEIFTAWLPWR